MGGTGTGPMSDHTSLVKTLPGKGTFSFFMEDEGRLEGVEWGVGVTQLRKFCRVLGVLLC